MGSEEYMHFIYSLEKAKYAHGFLHPETRSHKGTGNHMNFNLLLVLNIYQQWNQITPISSAYITMKREEIVIPRST